MSSTILRYNGFEIYCKPGSIDRYREENLAISNVVQTDNIYLDIKKGNVAKETDLEKNFGTSDYEECIKVMLDKGEYSLTTEERRKKVEQRKREIISYISKNYVDTKTNIKITIDIIEETLKKIKMTIDPHISGNKQAKDIIRKFINCYPVKKISIDGSLNIPYYLQEKMNKILSKYSDISSIYKNENICKTIYDLSIAPGDFDELMNVLQKVTNGEFEFNLSTDKVDNNSSKQSDDKIGKKKRKKKNKNLN